MAYFPVFPCGLVVLLAHVFVCILKKMNGVSEVMRLG